MATPTTLPATFVAGNVLTAAQMNDLRGAFRVLQVVSTTKTDAFTTTSTSYVDVTGLSASITPSATSSLILVLTGIQVGGSTSNDIGINLVRGSTNIAQSTGATNNMTFFGGRGTSGVISTFSAPFLDNPATTSATTYKFQIKAFSDTAYVNRRNDTTYGAISTITLMEISA